MFARFVCRIHVEIALRMLREREGREGGEGEEEEKKKRSINPASQCSLFRISVTEQARLTNIGRDHLRAVRVTDGPITDNSTCQWIGQGRGRH